VAPEKTKRDAKLNSHASLLIMKKFWFCLTFLNACKVSCRAGNEEVSRAVKHYAPCFAEIAKLLVPLRNLQKSCKLLKRQIINICNIHSKNKYSKQFVIFL
jgi:hypothetical protein